MIKQALRNMFSRKIPFLTVTALIALAAAWYTHYELHIAETTGSLIAYDAEQNTEDYGFILRVSLRDEQWERIFREYGVTESDQNDLRSGLLDGEVLAREYNVNLYPYQSAAVEGLARDYDLLIEGAFNKYVTNTGSNHQYRIFALGGGVINKPCVLEGRLPERPDELTVSPEYASYSNLNVGGVLDLNGAHYRITGFAWHPAYNYPAVIPGVIKEAVVYHPETQSNIFMTSDGLDRVMGYNDYAYQAKTKTPLGYAETRALYSALYDTNLFRSIDNAQETTTHGETYIRARGMHATSVALSLLFGAIALLISALVVKRLIEADRKQMGVLKAHGYTALETALPFTSFAAAASLMGAALGWVIGYYWRNSLTGPLYKNYNMPLLSFPVNYGMMALVILLPLAAMFAVSLATALYNLRKPPLDLINGSDNNSVNGLGRWMENVMRNTKFDRRVKYQMACRSRSRVAALLVTGFLAGALLIIGLLLYSAFSSGIDRTFKGMNMRNIVVFKNNRDAASEPPRFSDEEISQARDMFITEIRYRNGRVRAFDGSDRLKTETIGTDGNSAYVRLEDDKGNNLDERLKSGVVINALIQGRYLLQTGDTLVLYDPHENIEAALPISGIADQYSGALIFTGREYLNSLYGLPAGSYKAVLTNHQYNIGERGMDKIIAVSSLRRGMGIAMRIFQTLSLAALAAAVVIVFAVILISANMVIEENSRAISTLKTLGYSRREIWGMMVNIYTPVMALAYLLGIPAGLWLLGQLKIALETKFDTILVVSFNAALAAGGFAVMMAVYFICLHLSGRAIDKVVPAEALKIEG